MFDWLRGLINGEPPPVPAPHTPTPATAYPPKPFSPIPTEGPKLSQYPTVEDAKAARAGGFGYGEPTSAYIEGTAGRIFGDKSGPLPKEGTAPLPKGGIDLGALINRGFTTPSTQQMDPARQGLLQNNMTRAALAVNYSPVAALGFNPHDITADASGRSKFGGLSGATDPKTGKMFYDAGDPSAVVHESLHRGLMSLLDNPNLPPKLRERIDLYNPTDHEATVRQFMQRQVGNPEKDEVAQEQAAQGEYWMPEEIAVLNQLAQEAIKNRRPRGPR